MNSSFACPHCGRTFPAFLVARHISRCDQRPLVQPPRTADVFAALVRAAQARGVTAK